MNGLFLKHLGHMILPQGGYGQVKIKRDPKIKRPVVTKRALFVAGQEHHYANHNRLLTLSKELVLLNYTAHTGVTPRCVGHRSTVTTIEDRQVSLVKEIRMEFTGPTVDLCNWLGFLLDPTELFKDILRGCMHLHDCGVLHLDLKPDNVTYDLDQRRAKLIDLGMAEIVAFPDLAKECGLHKWKSLYGVGDEHVGHIEEGGVMNRYAPAGTLYFQSSFTRPHLGQARLKNAANVLGFRDPAYVCSETLGVQRGVALDASADVYAAGMIVLSHVLCQNIMFGVDVSKWSLNARVFTMLRNISLWRGALSHEETMAMERMLQQSAFLCEKSLNAREDVRTLHDIRFAAQLGGPSRGLLDEISGVLGPVLATLLLDAIHPVPSYRPTERQCLASLRLEDDGHKNLPPRHHRSPVSVSTECFFSGEGDVVTGRIMMNHVCIASVSVRWATHQLLWQQISRVFFDLTRTQERKNIACRLVTKMHSAVQSEMAKTMHSTVRCCRESGWQHAIPWFQSLSRDEVLLWENDFCLH